MKPRILLVNPWIHDFAAFNLWARPLGLLKVAEYLSAFDAELLFLDCTDSYKPNGHGIGLTAVRDFAEQMGGTAWIEALPGRGTRAGFCIPIAERPARTGGRSGAQGRQRWPRPKAS